MQLNKKNNEKSTINKENSFLNEKQNKEKIKKVKMRQIKIAKIKTSFRFLTQNFKIEKIYTFQIGKNNKLRKETLNKKHFIF